MRKLLFGSSFLLLCINASANEWSKTKLQDGLSTVDAVTINSLTSEEKISIYRKDSKRPQMYPPQMVFIKFEVNGIDQIQSNGNVIYKANNGKAYPLGTTSRLNTLTGAIESTAFHGESSKTCGIIGNIINSEKLVIRYETAGQKIKDVTFDLPSDSSAIFELLGFDKSKDCIELN